MTLDDYCEENELDVLKATGFDGCVIGYATLLLDGQSVERLVYDADRIIEQLATEFCADGTDKDEAYTAAVEYYDFNIACAYVGPKTPIYLRRIDLGNA